MFFIRLTIIKIKRMLRFLPGILAGALALCVISGILAFCASSLLYGGETVDKQQVGIVYPEGDRYIPLVLDMLENMDSVAAVSEFVPATDEQTALDMLERGELDAAVILPERFVQGVYYGDDVRARVILPRNGGVYTELFKGLADNGMRMLTAVQSGIQSAYYAADGDYSADDMDMTFLGLFMQRGRLFAERSISASGSLETSEYYIAVAAATVLLLIGMCLAFALGGENDYLREMLRCRGLGRLSIFIADNITVFIFYAAVLLLVIGGFLAAGIDIRVDVPALLLTLVLLSAFVTAVYSVFSPWSGALVLLALTLASAVAGGAVLPAAFLPEGLAYVGSFGPVYLIFSLISNIFYDSFAFNEVAAYTALLIFIYVLAAAVNLYREVTER